MKNHLLTKEYLRALLDKTALHIRDSGPAAGPQKRDLMMKLLCFNLTYKHPGDVRAILDELNQQDGIDPKVIVALEKYHEVVKFVKDLTEILYWTNFYYD